MSEWWVKTGSHMVLATVVREVNEVSDVFEGLRVLRKQGHPETYGVIDHHELERTYNLGDSFESFYDYRNFRGRDGLVFL